MLYYFQSKFLCGHLKRALDKDTMDIFFKKTI